MNGKVIRYVLCVCEIDRERERRRCVSNVRKFVGIALRKEVDLCVCVCAV